MNAARFIWSLLFTLVVCTLTAAGQRSIGFDFYGDSVQLMVDQPPPSGAQGVFSQAAMNAHVAAITETNYLPLTAALVDYKNRFKLDDWLFYQLIRKVTQQISPKEENYERYTVFKWFLLVKTGYSATLKIGTNRLLFYVQTDESIFNLPCYYKDGKQYVCLNYHDYNFTGNEQELLNELFFGPTSNATQSFTYKVTQLPNFKPGDYVEKELRFNYYHTEYQFRVKVNPQIKNIFANYPVVDYGSYFNIPLSRETYQSLIPELKKNIGGRSVKDGVDYLMRFTRYAFLFETDLDHFGREKRLSPEQTLLFDQSDCEDRAGLFFYLVKEIYDLPMIVLAFPQHVTIAVKFDKPVGKPILYNGDQYTICEPTPQQDDLSIGRMIPGMHKQAFEIVYAYTPGR